MDLNATRVTMLVKTAWRVRCSFSPKDNRSRVRNLPTSLPRQTVFISIRIGKRAAYNFRRSYFREAYYSDHKSFYTELTLSMKILENIQKLRDPIKLIGCCFNRCLVHIDYCNVYDQKSNLFINPLLCSGVSYKTHRIGEITCGIFQNK